MHAQLAAQFDPLFGMQDALAGAEDAQRGVTEAQTALNEALAGGDATAIAEAQLAYDDALRGAQGSLLDVQQAQITLNDAIAREKQIKGWNRAWKIKLIEKSNPVWNDLTPRIL